MRDFLILIPVVVLFTLGVFIALRSGTGTISGQPNSDGTGVRLVAGNFSSLLMRFVGYLAVLIAVQHFIGFPSFFIW